MLKKFLLIIVLIALALAVLFVWFKLRYSMEPAEPFEVNDPDLEQRVLIATQGSEYKDAIVTGVVEHLRQRPIYIKGIDVSGLATVDETDWDAIVVLHTWENRAPEPYARLFLGRAKEREKIIVLSTSGSGNQKIEGVDSITSASSMGDIPTHVQAINARLDQILKE